MASGADSIPLEAEADPNGATFRPAEMNVGVGEGEGVWVRVGVNVDNGGGNCSKTLISRQATFPEERIVRTTSRSTVIAGLKCTGRVCRSTVWPVTVPAWSKGSPVSCTQTSGLVGPAPSWLRNLSGTLDGVSHFALSSRVRRDPTAPHRSRRKMELEMRPGQQSTMRPVKQITIILLSLEP